MLKAFGNLPRNELSKRKTPLLSSWGIFTLLKLVCALLRCVKGHSYRSTIISYVIYAHDKFFIALKGILYIYIRSRVAFKFRREEIHLSKLIRAHMVDAQVPSAPLHRYYKVLLPHAYIRECVCTYTHMYKSLSCTCISSCIFTDCAGRRSL